MTRALAVVFAACVAVPAAFAASLSRAPLAVELRYSAAPVAGVAPVLIPLTVISAPLAPTGILSPSAAAGAVAVPLAVPVMAVAAAPALAARAAAALEAPQSPGGEDASQPGAARPSEEDAARAGARFDGTAPMTPAPAVPAPAKTKRVKFPLGAGLQVADPADEPWLAELVGTLARSKTGRRILRDIATLEAKRGHPTLVVIKAIGNNGEFRYDSDLLVMDATHRQRAPEQVAPIFAHELQHVLQRAWNLPVDVLELEVESYTVESQVWSELGIEPEAGSFARAARAHLRKGAEGFMAWLSGEYKNNRRVHGQTTAAYIAWLEAKRPANARRIARAEKDLDSARLVVASMRAEGKPEEFIRSFEQDDVEPIERRLRDAHIELGWIERDLKLLSTEEGRARLRAYARGVVRRARALSRS